MSAALTVAVKTKSGPLIVPASLPLTDRIAYRRRCVRMQEFEIIGRVYMMLFDPQGMNMPRATAPVFQPNMLDWMDRGPWIGQSCDSQDLLFISSVEHPPDIPDTRTHPPTMRKQRYSDRTQSRKNNFLVIQPVAQIVYKPKGIATYANLRASAGFDGLHMAFLIDPDTKEGHLIGGRYRISVV